MRRYLVALSAICCLSIAGCSSSSTPPDSTTSPSASVESTGAAGSGEATGDAGAPEAASCDQIKDLPTEKLAARLLGVGVTDYASAEQAVDLGVRHLFIGSQTDKSILNGQGDPKRSLAELQRRAGEPLTVSVDEEGGLVQRLTSLIGELPSAQQMAETMTPDQVRDMMRVHGEKMRALGITVDFAPDVDLAGGQEISDNAIGSRAFSADPQTVANYGRAYAEGLLQAGITPVLKHFPGHGHAQGDSHNGEVKTPPLDQMEQADMIPFAQLVSIPGVDVMVGHVEVPGLGAPGTPSSINPAAYELLRKGGYAGAPAFNGVVYTDDLTGMKAVTDKYPGGLAAVAALAAGADISLAAAGAVDIPTVVKEIAAAIDDGRIDRARAVESAQRSCR